MCASKLIRVYREETNALNIMGNFYWKNDFLTIKC